ncbi:tyrosine-type recombinase/integrase [Rhodalgimonas zhirmunskyi]|uniref:Integrase arm-type DNA-binding domain-containing protein n=1 Tax=Rhodalgimonas zhirmunskyi TaxID=2964767 RepID=A0AAJ1UAX7_9RHOB|nr:integrase arm-type DNA-binding domain-containing protein [Rhodoalgimonas zhirmunskyi]MDQ2094353.1 integrase arm-type DNA-binding domain-containing protein [Rhodoalgimonas zhirmunskyi]
MPLNDAQIRNLKPKDKPYKISDFEGLYLDIRPSGSKLWRMKYRFKGKEKLLALGAYPAVSLSVARKSKDAARAILAQGNDPGAVRQEEKREAQKVTEHTFGKLADQFIDKARREGRAPATMAKTEWLLGMAKAEFGTRPIAEITAPDILVVLRKVEAKGNYETAKRLRSKIGAVFRYAVANGAAQNDPTYALQGALIRPQVTARAAIIEPEALGALLRAIDGFHGQPTTRIGLQLLSLVAQRPGEIRHAKWQDIDTGNAVWSIPAEQMKMRRAHYVPLPGRALELIEELREITGTGIFLFPSLRSYKRPMSENTLNAALRRIGYSGDEMTAHGFRATFSKLANESGLWHPDAIERQLAHVEGNVVRRAYARGLHWEERVRMSEWWAGYLDELRAG